MKTLLIVSLVIISCSLALPHFSFASNGKPLDEQVKLASLLLENTFKAIKEKAPAKYQNELNSLTYKLIKSLDPSLIHTNISGTKNEIEISVGAVLLLVNLAYANAASVFIEGGPAKMVDWIRAVSKEIESKNYIYNGFLTYSGIEGPKQEWFPAILRGNIYASISFVLAHECAHTLLGHTAASFKNVTNEKIRSLEYEADRLSVELIAPLAEGNPTAYMFYSSGYHTLFLYSMSRNMDMLAFETMREHPPEVKRAVELAGIFYQKAFKNFSSEKDLKLVENDYNNRIIQLKYYGQIIQYQNYIYDPNNEVISLKEWQKLTSGNHNK